MREFVVPFILYFNLNPYRKRKSKFLHFFQSTVETVRSSLHIKK